MESKHLVGVGQARNRRRRAIQCTVPLGLVCYSLLVCWYTLNGHAADDVTARRARSPWYRHKRTPVHAGYAGWRSAARCWPNITALTQLSPPARNLPTRC